MCGAMGKMYFVMILIQSTNALKFHLTERVAYQQVGMYFQKAYLYKILIIPDLHYDYRNQK
jgi:hypothetical protein